mgnify:CR=1 FL=1
MYTLRKYHDDKVQSLTYEKGGVSASVGIMDVGEYEFGAMEKETTTVTSGRILVMLSGDKEWKVYKPFKTFIIPGHTNFRLKVDEISTYLCYYG